MNQMLLATTIKNRSCGKDMEYQRKKKHYNYLKIIKIYEGLL